MAEFRTSWWEFTGRHSPADKHGIMRGVYRNLDSGEELDRLPVGALLAVDHAPKGPDGLSIVCIVPHEKHETTWWYIDSRASNCTMPDENDHRCWVRHGTLRGTIHVDKNGHTCAAGAGSIAVRGFHGFLHHGVLRDC